jgi:hypothetical protein
MENIAKRPSGSATTGFYRPGERAQDGAPFATVPATCPPYLGRPSGRIPTADEKRGAWQLQEEYVAGRLGKNEEENARNWSTAKWIDRHYRIATIPADATKAMNLSGGDTWEVVVDPNEIRGREDGEFGVMGFKIDDADRKRLALTLSDSDVLCLMDAFDEIDDAAKINVKKLKGKAGPLSDRIDFPTTIAREESGKIVRILMMRMRTLWRPVIRAIAGHATMKSLAPNVGDGVAAAVGRQRVIEGLRFAGSIRKEFEWPELGFKVPSVDAIIQDTLAILARKSLPAPDKPLHANDNDRAVAATLTAA